MIVLFFKKKKKQARLDLSECDLDVASLAPVLAVIGTLRELDLSGNVLDPDQTEQCVRALCDVLRLPRLAVVSLARMHLSGAMMGAFLSACTSSGSADEALLELDLSDNIVPPKAFSNLCDLIAPLRLRLRALSLDACRITGVGLARLLTNGLMRCDQLAKLSLVFTSFAII